MFNPIVFQQVLRNMGFTEAQYVEMARGDVARNQMLGSVGADVPPGVTQLMQEIRNEARVPEYVLLTPADAGAIPAPSR